MPLLFLDDPAPGPLTVMIFTMVPAVAAAVPLYLTSRMEPRRKASRRRAMMIAGVPLLFAAVILGSVLVPAHGTGPIKHGGVDTGERIFFNWTMGEMLLRTAIMAVGALILIWAAGAIGERTDRRESGDEET
jgi:hypothetical protein